MPGDRARSDRAGERGRVARYDLEWARGVRDWRRMERRGDGKSRRAIQASMENRARKSPRDARNLEQGGRRVSRRVREFRSDLVLPEAGAERRPAGVARLAIEESFRARRGLLRWMVADQQSSQRLARVDQNSARA